MNNTDVIAAEIRNILRAVEDGGELSDEMLSRLETLSGEEIPDQINTLTRVLRDAKLDAESLKGEVAALTKRKRSKEGVVDRVMREIQTLMDAAGLDSLAVGAYRAYTRTGPFSVVLDDAVANVDTLPEDFVRVEKSVNLQLLQQLRSDGRIEKIPSGVTFKQSKYLVVGPR